MLEPSFKNFLTSMNITSVYAIATGGIIITLVLFKKILYYLTCLATIIRIQISKYLTYPYLLDRHQLFGPWIVAGVLIHLFYLLINVFCLSFQLLSARDAGRRAGALALVNMACLFTRNFQSFFAVSLCTRQQIHRATGWMTSALLTFHIIALLVIEQWNFPSYILSNLFAIIVCFFFCAED